MDFRLTEYFFEETGYDASVQCDHTSHPDNLKIEYQKNQGNLGVFRLRGYLSNMTQKANDPVIA